MPEEHRPGTVIVGIMTDGHENASKEWTRAAVKKLIEEQENQYDWTFSYWAPTRTPSKWAPPRPDTYLAVSVGIGVLSSHRPRRGWHRRRDSRTRRTHSHPRLTGRAAALSANLPRRPSPVIDLHREIAA